MAVKRMIAHSWGSPAVLDGSNMHPYWTCSSSRPMLQINLGSSGTSSALSGAATTGVVYANGVNSILSKVNEAIDSGAVGKRNDEYSIYVHGWSNRNDMRGFNNALDRIEGWFAAYPDDATNGGPFIANGIAECKAWADIFLESLKDELDSLGLPYPVRFHMDTETTFDVGSVYATMATSSGYEGWMQFALDDPRATTELIDGVNTFQEFVDNWQPLSGGELTWSTTNVIWDGVNRNLREMLSHLGLRMRDWLHEEGMMKKARELFPGMTWGNWNHGQIGDRDNPGYGRGKGDQRYYEDTGPYSEWTSPALYPFRGTALQGGGSEKDDWAANVGVTLGYNGPPYDDDNGLLWSETQRLNATRAVAVGGADTFCPWINHPQEAYVLNQFRDGVDLVTIDSADADKFAVGNTISLRNEAEEEVYTADIVRIVDLDNGTHQINIQNLDPSDESSFALIDSAYDTVLQDTPAQILTISSEPTYTYFTRIEDIKRVLDKCIELGVTEYIFWQGSVSDEIWLQIAETIDYTEEGLGVRLGEATRPSIEQEGLSVAIKFNPPANGPWVLENIRIDNNNAPDIILGNRNLPYEPLTSENLSIDQSGRLTARLLLRSAPIKRTDVVDVRLREGWLCDDVPQFRNAAVTNVQQGFDANQLVNIVRSRNQSRFERNDDIAGDERPVGSSVSPVRIRNQTPNFLINNQSFKTKQGATGIEPVELLAFRDSAVVNLTNSFGTRIGEDVEIRYTINGGVPTKGSPLYTGPIRLDSPISNGEVVTIQAKVFDKESIVSGKLLKIELTIS